MAGDKAEEGSSQEPSPEVPCPLGPSLQKYWNRLSPKEREMQLDAEALYSLVVQEVGMEVARLTPGEHVVDAFCGAGGNAIAFARAGKRVTAIELDEKRLDMARFNADLFGVSKLITFIHGDSLKYLNDIEAPTLYFAPPWGGPEYSKLEHFTLGCFSPDGNEILTRGFSSKRNVVMQVPRNFDLNELKNFGRNFFTHYDRLASTGEHLSYTLFFKGGV